MKNYNDQVTFTINQVAKLLGIVPATIRNWEKNGLISPKRSDTNYRIFTVDDLELLQKIKVYSVDKRMGAHAIKMLLPQFVDSDIEQSIENQKSTYYSKKLLSAKWKGIRETQGYTLEEVSRAVGISAAHLSKLENGNVNISLDTLSKLAHFYGESPLYFVEPSQQESHLVRKDCGEPLQMKDNPGFSLSSLVSLKDHMMYPVLCEVEPGMGSFDYHTHNGEEIFYILSGTIEISLEGQAPYDLKPGDTFYYYGSQSHMWKNSSNKTAKLLWIHCSLSK